MNWKGIIAKSCSISQFAAYVAGIDWSKWKPAFIVLHNTGAPNLAQRPDGLTMAHIKNLEVFYRDQQKWSAGPHLFVDHKQIWIFSPLNSPGVHSPSWNTISFGIEMLGDYSKESFTTGRGAAVRNNAVAAMAIICNALKLDPAKIKLHKEDPQTTHDCPGHNVIKEDVIAAVKLQLTSANQFDNHLPG